MKTLFLLALVATMPLAPAVAQTNLSAPPFPPKDWSVWIHITLSRDLINPFLEKKPGRNDFIHFMSVDLRLDSKGGLAAPLKHPVLTGKLPSNNFAEHESIIGSTVARVPLKDQESIYAHALEAASSFAFARDFKHDSFDASGIDIDLRLEINGRSIAVNYRKVQPKDGLPQPILGALAAMRRHLPATYDNFFTFLQVPKLAALPAGEADKFAQCPVHLEWMKSGSVPISYGFPAAREAYWKAAKELFPNARTFVGGGCVVTSGSPQSSQELYCESCRAAETAWVKDNESSPEQK